MKIYLRAALLFFVSVGGLACGGTVVEPSGGGSGGERTASSNTSTTGTGTTGTSTTETGTTSETTTTSTGTGTTTTPFCGTIDCTEGSQCPQGTFCYSYTACGIPSFCTPFPSACADTPTCACLDANNASEEPIDVVSCMDETGGVYATGNGGNECCE